MQSSGHTFVKKGSGRRYFSSLSAQDCFAQGLGRVRKDQTTVYLGIESRAEVALPARLDAIDRRILKELQDDGRITNVELARRVGVSPPPCLRRVRALEEAGYIKGYRALLDEKRLGYEVTVFAMVHLTSQSEVDLKAFEDFVRREPLVRECWMLSGEIDFILKCVAPDLKTFQAFVAELTAAPHVRNVKTSLTLRNSKDAAMVPMEQLASE
jgi:DNA-binding Lrp family transcriptional regulator